MKINIKVALQLCAGKNNLVLIELFRFNLELEKTEDIERKKQTLRR